MELGDSESIDLFLREEDARRAALEDALRDEPDWWGCSTSRRSNWTRQAFQ